MGEKGNRRKLKGCRLLDNKAVSKNNHSAYGITINHCPGIYVSSPFLGSLNRLNRALDSGFTLGGYWDTPYCIVESLSLFKHYENLFKVEEMEREAREMGELRLGQ